MNALQLFEPNRKLIFNIKSSISIMSKIIMFMKTVFIISQSKCFMPFHPHIFPVFKPIQLFARLNKKLHLHLFKFTHTKDKLTGYNLISESFANLRNAKWQLHPPCL